MVFKVFLPSLKEKLHDMRVHTCHSLLGSLVPSIWHGGWPVNICWVNKWLTIPSQGFEHHLFANSRSALPVSSHSWPEPHFQLPSGHLTLKCSQPSSRNPIQSSYPKPPVFLGLGEQCYYLHHCESESCFPGCGSLTARSSPNPLTTKPQL